MEDYLIREIDRIGELLVQIAHRLGLFGGQEHFSEKALETFADILLHSFID